MCVDLGAYCEDVVEVTGSDRVRADAVADVLPGALLYSIVRRLGAALLECRRGGRMPPAPSPRPWPTSASCGSWASAGGSASSRARERRPRRRRHPRPHGQVIDRQRQSDEAPSLRIPSSRPTSLKKETIGTSLRHFVPAPPPSSGEGGAPVSRRETHRAENGLSADSIEVSPHNAAALAFINSL